MTETHPSQYKPDGCEQGKEPKLEQVTTGVYVFTGGCSTFGNF